MKKLYPNKTIKDFSYLIGNKAIIVELTKNLNEDNSFTENAIVFNTDKYDFVINLLEGDLDNLYLDLAKEGIECYMFGDIFSI